MTEFNNDSNEEIILRYIKNSVVNFNFKKPSNPKYDQGYFTLDEEAKKKYIGTKTPFYRSSWEKRLFNYFIMNKNVIKWSSEPFSIPYLNKVDGRVHNYIIDFFAIMLDKQGNTGKYLVEVKPLFQCKPPPVPKRKTKRYIDDCNTFIKNQCKWEAADKFCKQQGWKFIVITEKELF